MSSNYPAPLAHQVNFLCSRKNHKHAAFTYVRNVRRALILVKYGINVKCRYEQHLCTTKLFSWYRLDYSLSRYDQGSEACVLAQVSTYVQGQACDHVLRSAFERFGIQNLFVCSIRIYIRRFVCKLCSLHLFSAVEALFFLHLLPHPHRGPFRGQKSVACRHASCLRMVLEQWWKRSRCALWLNSVGFQAAPKDVSHDTL